MMIPQLHKHTVDWVRRMKTEGDANPSTIISTNNFVKSATNKGYWHQLKRVNLLCGDSISASLHPLKVEWGSRDYDINIGFTPDDYSDDSGFQTDGTAKYLKIAVSSTSSIDFDNCHLSYYCRNNVNGSRGYNGWIYGGHSFDLLVGPARNVILDTWNSTDGRTDGGVISGKTGFLLGTRTANNLAKIFRDGSILTTNTTSVTTTALPSPPQEYYFFALNYYNNLPFTLWGTQNQSSYTVGDGLDDTQSVNLSTDTEEFHRTMHRS